MELTASWLGSTIDVNLAIVGRDAELGKDPAYISQYSDFLKLSASFALEWEPYMRKTEGGEEIQQLATYYFGGYLYDGVQTEIPVEVATGTDNIFRLVDWAAGANFMFKVDWKSKTVVVPGQSTGYYLDSGERFKHSRCGSFRRKGHSGRGCDCPFHLRQRRNDSASDCTPKISAYTTI